MFTFYKFLKKFYHKFFHDKISLGVEMNIQKVFAIVNRDLDLLAPFVRTRGVQACNEAQHAGYPISIFEGFRTPFRQDALYSQGRTQAGKIVTDRQGWQSSHQFGLAFDVAYYISGRWSWDGDFTKIAPFFTDLGFKWMHPFEDAHYEICGGLEPDEMKRISNQFGLPTLWAVVKDNMGIR